MCGGAAGPKAKYDESTRGTRSMLAPGLLRDRLLSGGLGCPGRTFPQYLRLLRALSRDPRPTLLGGFAWAVGARPVSSAREAAHLAVLTTMSFYVSQRQYANSRSALPWAGYLDDHIGILASLDRCAPSGSPRGRCDRGVPKVGVVPPVARRPPCESDPPPCYNGCYKAPRAASSRLARSASETP